jgi:hypothetical protein
MGELRTGQERMLIQAIEGIIETRLLTSERDAKEPSLLAQVQKGFASAATEVLRTTA